MKKDELKETLKFVGIVIIIWAVGSLIAYYAIPFVIAVDGIVRVVLSIIIGFLFFYCPIDYILCRRLEQEISDIFFNQFCDERGIHGLERDILDHHRNAKE